MDVKDQSQDLAGRELHRLTTLYPPPSFVKSASSHDICGDPERLPPQVYADPRRRMYPCHTAAATWMSAAFFMDKRAEFNNADRELIEGRISELAAYHGVAGEVRELLEKMATDANTSKNALPDECFALVWRGDDGTKHRNLPLRNASEVKRAASYLKEYRDRFVFADRQHIASRILEKAGEYGASLGGLDDFLHRQAGNGSCATKDAAAMIRQRAKLAKQPDMREQLEKVAEAVELHPQKMKTPDYLHKLAELVDQCDRNLGLVGKYNEVILPPEDVLFVVTEKLAATFVEEHVQNASGNIYKVADLRRIPVDGLRDVMGDHFADEVAGDGMLDMERFASITPTLPRGDAEMLDRFLGDVGVYPFAKEAAAKREGLSRKELFALAASRS